VHAALHHRPLDAEQSGHRCFHVDSAFPVSSSARPCSHARSSVSTKSLPSPVARLVNSAFVFVSVSYSSGAGLRCYRGTWRSESVTGRADIPNRELSGAGFDVLIIVHRRMTGDVVARTNADPFSLALNTRLGHEAMALSMAMRCRGRIPAGEKPVPRPGQRARRSGGLPARDGRLAGRAGGARPGAAS
jgi:hypothetical protein